MFLKSLPFRLLVALVLGLLLGNFLGVSGNATTDGIMNAIMSIRHISNQIIMFAVPLIIFGTVAPSIARMGKNASRLLGFSVLFVYVFSLAAAFFSYAVGSVAVPVLANVIPATAEARRSLPSMLFQLNIPPIMPVLSAMALAIFIGLGAVWAKAEAFSKILEDLNNMTIQMVTKIVIPILPVFIAAAFAQLAFDGRFTIQLPVFLAAVLVIIVAQWVWLAILHVVAFVYTGKNPLETLKHYGSAYLTAAGTMSSSATLPVALEAAKKSPVLNKKMVDFGMPLFAHIHMCGSAITLIFLAMTASMVIYGSLPPVHIMILYIFLQCIFTVSAPGVPGGTLMASLGLIVAVLGFEDGGTAIALMLAIFPLQDSFGTATNITSDGPMVLILSKYAEKRGLDTVEE